jgi:hypothetical protein
MTSNADLVTSGIALVECPDTPASDRNFRIGGYLEVNSAISEISVYPVIQDNPEIATRHFLGTLSCSLGVLAPL